MAKMSERISLEEERYIKLTEPNSVQRFHSNGFYRATSPGVWGAIVHSTITLVALHFFFGAYLLSFSPPFALSAALVDLGHAQYQGMVDTELNVAALWDPLRCPAKWTFALRHGDNLHITGRGFVCFAANLDPNEKLPPSITPMLPKWSRGAEAEMAFNKTDAGNCTGECAAE
ncbi:hypothetical protein B0H13DRAFT_1860740 [Mycena leptocephala]|nr:hypothetical protein B0H13DRAFT_1860740 [Mycena leptocephala]